jgi:sugar lactone lactonase YvrE
MEEIMKRIEQRQTRFRNGLVAAAASLILAMAAAPAEMRAQSLRPWYGFGPTTVENNSADGAGMVAADAAGNFYYWAGNGETTNIVQVSPSGSQTTVYSGSVFPVAMAIDHSGNLYLVDFAGNRVVEATPSGSQTVIASGFNQPRGVAVDGAGNVYVADYGNNRVVETTAAGITTTLASGLAKPLSVAVDPAGNVYVATSGYTGVGLVEIAPGGTQTILPYEAESLATDQYGDVFLAEPGPQITTVMLAPDGSLTTVNIGAATGSIAVDGLGNVFMADVGQSIYKVTPATASLGSVNVCSPGSSNGGWNATLNYDVTGSGTVGNISLLTMGQPNLDFTLRSSSCTGSVTAGSICSVNFNFAPQAPGLRRGAIQVADTNGNALASTLLHGAGVGPQVAYAPVQTTFAGGFNSPEGVLADGTGNIYVADTQNHRVVKIASDGSQTNYGSGYFLPAGLAMDGAGDLYVSDGGIIWEVQPNGTQSSMFLNVTSSTGLAMDGAGNLYVSDGAGSQVVEYTHGVQISVGSGWAFPEGLAFDAAGDLFVADFNDARVVELPAGGGSPVTIASINGPMGVALDTAGDVFIAGYYQLTEIVVGGSQVFLGEGGANVTVDALGNLFMVNNTAVMEWQRAQVPILTFAATAVGSTSSDSPQSVTLQNIGNANLTATGLSVSTNFAQMPGSGSPADCSATTVLVAGASCNISVSFTPTAGGPLTGAVVLTDNALNGNLATQSIALNGTGQFLSQTITFASIPSETQGMSFTLSASASSGLTVSFSSLTTTVCTASGTSVTLANGGTCSIQASQAGNSQYSAAAPVTQSFTVLAKQTITFNAISAQVIGANVALSATASSGLTVSFASTTPTICSVSGTTATTLEAGTCSIQASQAGNSQYAAATSVTQSFTVSQGATFTITASPSSETVIRGIPLAGFELTLHSVNGFNGTVKLSCSAGTIGSVCLGFPESLHLNGTAKALTAILFPFSTPPGTYTVTFTGVSGTVTASGTASFTVKAN